MATFVNPYTFVPNVPVPERRLPAGHAAMGATRFSGVLEVTVTARTPLLIGGFSAEDAEVKGLPRRQDGTVMIPGSGLMGAVRSLHEALTGSCLRIVDTEWVPVHRHPVNTEETDGLVMAAVDEVDRDGQARSVRLGGDWVKIPKELLPGIGGTGEELPQAGDQLRFEPGVHAAGDALRVRDEGQSRGIAPGEISRFRRMGRVSEDCWVLLLTDTNARTVQRRDGKPVPVRFAAGRVGPDARRCAISDQVWEKYQKTVEGADDLRTAALVKAGFTSGKEPLWGASSPEYADVWWPPRGDADGDQVAVHGNAPGPGGGPRGQERQLVGRRLRARSYLHVGQPVWVRVSGAEVTEIRLSLYWRYQGSTSVGDRLGAAKPCTNPKSLCWSCRMFGSADTEARAETDLAVQRGYRGHIRIDDLLAAGPVEAIKWELAPLAAPKPSAGQFYLDNSAVSGDARIAKRDTKAASTWGSIADDQRARPVRGRKFYWRTETDAKPDAGPPTRGRRRAHQSETMSAAVSLIPAGTVFRGRITFDNLDTAEYGSLLAALDPRLIGQPGEDGWEKAVTSVGGGKPFGFGSVTIDVRRVSAATAAQRYLGKTSPEPPGEAEAARAFAAEVPDAVRATWTALKHALEFGFIDDAKVWYPPGTGERGSQGYDKSFEFFARTTGLRLSGDRYRDLVVLPDPALPAAKQDLDSATGEHGGPGQERRPQQERRERRGR
jgi:CRISPR-associated protein (TIGR03986 family)